MMANYALRTNDGDVWPDQVCYVDGYWVAERLLEGARFKVEVKTNDEGLAELVCNEVHPESKTFVEDMGSTDKIKQWRDRAVDFLINDGNGMTEDGETELHWGDA